jgi:hypothetical protein
LKLKIEEGKPQFRACGMQSVAKEKYQYAVGQAKHLSLIAVEASTVKKSAKI